MKAHHKIKIKLQTIRHSVSRAQDKITKLEFRARRYNTKKKTNRCYHVLKLATSVSAHT